MYLSVKQKIYTAYISKVFRFSNFLIQIVATFISLMFKIQNMCIHRCDKWVLKNLAFIW